jgi:hypothetical protein
MEEWTYKEVNEKLMKASNPLHEMFNTEELWLDTQVKDGIIAIISNWPHPEITAKQAKSFNRFLNLSLVRFTGGPRETAHGMPVFLPDGPIEIYY